MKRLATLVLAAGFSLSSLVATGLGASATPFSDVPANHWAYQAIQSLAADGLVEGYPDGKFKGDRPLTRYEMAMLVARVIAKVQANGAGYASKADLDKLQKLMDALKDELDSLGVRVTNLEDALDALDKRTKFAQSIAFHGTILDNTSFRQRLTFPVTLPNAAGTRAQADAYLASFLTTPPNNSPLEQTGSGVRDRFDDKFNFIYTVNENLTVSIPIHIINYQWGGEFTPQAKYSVQPDVQVNIARAGAFTNMYLRYGELDNMQSSRLGLAYRAPDASQQGPGYLNPVQPYERGFEIGGVVSGQLTFQASFTRQDLNELNTLTNVPEFGGNGVGGDDSQQTYFFYRTPPQQSLIQAAQPNQTYSFTANNSSQSFVYLPNRVVAGTIFVQSVNGAACWASGNPLSGPGVTGAGGVGATGVPAAGASPLCTGFYFIDQNNEVVFTRPIPAGTTVTLVFTGLTYAQSNWQRYHINTRLNYKIKGLPGAEVGFSFSRIYDFADLANSQGVTAIFQAPAGQPTGNGYGLVSDTVFGGDFQVPLPIAKGFTPILFGEGAFSKYTPDFYNTPSVTDSAGVVGLRFKFGDTTLSLQYQAVGKNFLSGAPFRYFGPPPSTFSQWTQPFFPQFFGFGNNLAINQTLDAATGTHLSTNPNFTFIYPVYNPFVASGPSFFSAFAPNTQGETLNLTAPLKIGDTTFQTNVLAQHLDELTINGFGQLTFNGVPTSNTKMRFDKAGGGVTFPVPVFGTKVAVNLSGDWEHLVRHDQTAYAYAQAPGNPNIQNVGFQNSLAGLDAANAAALAAYAAAGGAPVLYFPNFIDMTHATVAAGASVPLSRDLVFAAAYNNQQYGGKYGTTLGQNISETKQQYQGTLTYNIPKTTSSVSFLFRNQVYKDGVLPSYNFNGNREDVTFTIRF